MGGGWFGKSRLPASGASLACGIGFLGRQFSACWVQKMKTGAERWGCKSQVQGLGGQVYRVRTGILVLGKGWGLKSGVGSKFLGLGS